MEGVFVLLAVVSGPVVLDLLALRFGSTAAARRIVSSDCVVSCVAWFHSGRRGYFRRWREDGTRQRLHNAVRAEVRRAAGRDPQPSAATLDSQSRLARQR